MTNQQLAEELQKPTIRTLEKRKVHSCFTDNVCGADLTDMQLTSKYNKEFRFLLYVINSFRKYGWVVPLTTKKILQLLSFWVSLIAN